MANSRRRKVFISIALFVSLGLILSATAGWSAKDGPTPHAHVQMSRIDFEAPLSDRDAAMVRKVVMSAPGVKHCFINQEAGLLTFGYDLRVQTGAVVVQNVQEETPFNAHLFKVPASMGASACPVTGKGSVLGRTLAFLDQAWPF